MALCATLLLVPQACGSQDEEADGEASLPSVTFTAKDFSFEGPETLDAGLTEVRLVNEGEELHHLQISKLDEGKTMDDLGAFMAESDGAPPPWLTDMGGPNAVMPGAEASSFVPLEPGTYAILCAIPSPDNVLHLDKGMIGSFQVEGETAEMAAPPEADLVLKGSDFAFDYEGEIGAGKQVVRFENQGDQVHEATLIRLDEGASADDFAAAFGPDAPPGPPPGAGAGGVVGVAVGDGQSFEVTLEPGRYAWICFLPDPTSGAPHFALGMQKEFEVQ
jgi:plastocyanin